MPELPEVENVVNTLEPKLLGARLAQVEVLAPSSILCPEASLFAANLAGRQVQALRRRAKYIVITLDDGYFLVIHLRMTGRLLFADPAAEPPRHARVKFTLSDGSLLWYCDMRRFGRLALVRQPEDAMPILGPEPFDPALDAASFRSRLAHSRRPIKTVLLDQAVIAGLGNIYADEALFRAGINPHQSAASISATQAETLLSAVRSVLSSAIANRGTTFSNYVDAEGHPGHNQESLCVYGRAGQPCLHCQTILVSHRISGRSACFCPRCQANSAEPV